MQTFIVYVHRGGFSIVSSNLSKEEAHKVATALNERFQTDEYRVQPWDPERAFNWSPEHALAIAKEVIHGA